MDWPPPLWTPQFCPYPTRLSHIMKTYCNFLSPYIWNLDCKNYWHHCIKQTILDHLRPTFKIWHFPFKERSVVIFRLADPDLLRKMLTGFTTWVESEKFQDMMHEVASIRKVVEEGTPISYQEFKRVRDIILHLTGMQNGCRLGAMRALTWGKYYHRQSAFFPQGQTNPLDVPDSWRVYDGRQERAEEVGTFVELNLCDGSVKNPGEWNYCKTLLTE